MSETPGTPPRRDRRLRRALAGAAAAVALAVAVPAVAGVLGVDLADSLTVALRASDAKDEPSDVCVGTCDAPASRAADRTARPTPTPASIATERSRADAVSIVAACAPRGQDPLFEVTGELRTHGDFVAAAAAGDTLALPFGSYDLATVAGAASLCQALDAQRTARATTSGESTSRREPTAKPSRTPKPPRESATPRPGAGRGREDSASPKADRTATQTRPSPRRSSNPRPSKTR